MNNFSLNPEMDIEVTARFIAKGTDAPLTGELYKVRLFDKDVFDDDYIGESGLDDNGQVSIKFNQSAFGDLGNLEKTPDLYFAVLKNGVQIFQSKVMEEVDVNTFGRFKMGEGEVIDLGTYLVES